MLIKNAIFVQNPKLIIPIIRRYKYLLKFTMSDSALPETHDKNRACLYRTARVVQFTSIFKRFTAGGQRRQYSSYLQKMFDVNRHRRDQADNHYVAFGMYPTSFQRNTVKHLCCLIDFDLTKLLYTTVVLWNNATFIKKYFCSTN